MSIGDNVGLFVAIEVLDRLAEAFCVFDLGGLTVPEDDRVGVLDVVIEEVVVRLLAIVVVSIEYLDDEAQPVDVLEIAPVLLDDGDADEVFELFCEELEQAELVDVLDEDVDPVEVFELVVVLVNRGEDVIVDEVFEESVGNGDEVVVLDIAAVLVDVRVLANVRDPLEGV